MKVLVWLAISICICNCYFVPITHNLVSEIKEKATTWVPYEIDENPFANRSPLQLLAMFGSHRSKSNDYNKPTTIDDAGLEDIPEEFSALKQWKDCMLPVIDQELCGADWALTAVEILTERFCIQSNGTKKVEMLSVNDVLSCDFDDWGCSGGYPEQAWEFIQGQGVVTEECFPFKSKDGHREKCPFSKCVGDNEEAEYKKYYSMDTLFFYNDTKIQQEILKNGPVHTEFDVYSDFLNYKSGIYQHVSGGRLGFYSAKIVGWGVDKSTNTPYWLASSSFGSSWGEKGYFRILRGSNHCNFENNAMAGSADFNRP